MKIDFGAKGIVCDALNGSFVCCGSGATLLFRVGETRLFRIMASDGKCSAENFD